MLLKRLSIAKVGVALGDPLATSGDLWRPAPLPGRFQSPILGRLTLIGMPKKRTANTTLCNREKGEAELSSLLVEHIPVKGIM